MSISLNEALRLGRENSECGIEHRQNLEYLGHFVEEYAAKNWHVKAMTELGIHHVLQLIRDMKAQGRSASYIRHVVNTIRLASNYASDYYGIPNIKIEQRHLPEILESPKIWLTYRQLSKACAIARDTTLRKRIDTTKSQPRPMELARLIVMACGLCGLRLTEFCRLTPDSLDATGNLAILQAKNESSKRIVPLPALVADAMREYWAHNKHWTQDRTSNAQRVRLLFRATYDATNDDLYTMTPPKNLRKSFVNQLDDVVEDKYLMAYGGWAFKGTMHRKYQALRARPCDPSQIRERALGRLRETVVAAIEKKMC